MPPVGVSLPVQSGFARIPKPNEPLDMLKFIYTMDKAEKMLKDAATAELNKRLEFLGRGGYQTIINKRLYSGLWAKPIIADTLFGIPGQEMTSDLSHKLAMNEFPQTIFATGGQVDVAKALGQSIFSKPPTDPLAVDVASSEPYSVVSTELDSADVSQSVICTHTYYAIPSGGEGNETSWHATINLTASQTPDALKRCREERIRLSRVPEAIELTFDETVDINNIWQVTLDILWTAAHYATKAAPPVANYILASEMIFEIRYNNMDGLTAFLQVKEKSGVTPFQAREAVVTATNQAILDVEAQKPTAATTKGVVFKPTTLVITQVEIVANKLIEYEAPDTPVKKTGVANGSTNEIKQVPQKLTAGRRLVSFQQFPEEFGNSFDENGFHEGKAQFYVPVFSLRQEA